MFLNRTLDPHSACPIQKYKKYQARELTEKANDLQPIQGGGGRVVILSVASSQRNRDKLQLGGLLNHPFSPTEGLELDCLPVVTKATLEVNNYLRRREL